MERQIKIQGSVSKRVTPDTATVNITITGISATQHEAQITADKEIKKINDLLAATGNKSKSRSFSINKEYSYDVDGKGKSTRTFIGYRYVHELFVTVDIKNDDLSVYIDAISETDSDYSVYFSVKNIDQIKKSMTLDALDKCKEKATSICAHENCTLGKLVGIEYYFNEETEEGSAGEMMMRKANMVMADSESIASFVSPADVYVAESITAIWSFDD